MQMTDIWMCVNTRVPHIAGIIVIERRGILALIPISTAVFPSQFGRPSEAAAAPPAVRFAGWACSLD